MVAKVVNSVESIPTSLYRALSEKLVSVILGSENIDAIPISTTKKIIYLWRIDLLASKEGIEALLKAGSIVDYLETMSILNELGLKNLKGYVRSLRAAQLNS